jgi:3-deoxy-D-manno-octulosonate 8-phosphate phosphatase (KDO 8-P phosphatase)
LEIQERAARVKLLLMDVDGVLTDSRVYFLPMPDGTWTETKGFDSQDGIALHWLHWTGIKTGIISGRKSPAVEMRALQGHMSYCYQGHLEKIPILEEILKDSGLSGDEVGYIGDDLTDVVVMNRVGFAVAVANARDEVKRRAHYVTSARGGSGALREVGEVLLKARGLWDQVLKKYELE